MLVSVDLSADHLHVLLDALATHDLITGPDAETAGLPCPWDTYHGDPADDPKVTAEGYRRLLNEAHATLVDALNHA